MSAGFKRKMMLVDSPPVPGEVSDVLVGALPASRCLVGEVTVTSQFELYVDWSDREDRKRVVQRRRGTGYSNLEDAKTEISLFRHAIAIDGGRNWLAPKKRNGTHINNGGH